MWESLLIERILPFLLRGSLSEGFISELDVTINSFHDFKDFSYKKLDKVNFCEGLISKWPQNQKQRCSTS